MTPNGRELVNLGRREGGAFLIVERVHGIDAVYYTAYWDHRDNSFRLYYRTSTSAGRHVTPLKGGTKVYDDDMPHARQ